MLRLLKLHSLLFFFPKGTAGPFPARLFWRSLQHWVTFLTNSLDHCVSVSGYDCRLCLSVGKSPLRSASCSEVHGGDLLFLGVREKAIPEDRQRKQKTWGLFLLLSGGLDFSIESESRHNPLAEVEKHSLYFNYGNKNCLKTSPSCCWALPFYQPGCGKRPLDVVHIVEVGLATLLCHCTCGVFTRRYCCCKACDSRLTVWLPGVSHFWNLALAVMLHSHTCIWPCILFHTGRQAFAGEKPGWKYLTTFSQTPKIKRGGNKPKTSLREDRK